MSHILVHLSLVKLKQQRVHGVRTSKRNNERTRLKAVRTSRHRSCHLLASISSRGGLYLSRPRRSGSITQCMAASWLHPGQTHTKSKSSTFTQIKWNYSYTSSSSTYRKTPLQLHENTTSDSSRELKTYWQEDRQKLPTCIVTVFKLQQEVRTSFQWLTFSCRNCRIRVMNVSIQRKVKTDVRASLGAPWKPHTCLSLADHTH